jgi:hypothetical protein
MLPHFPCSSHALTLVSTENVGLCTAISTVTPGTLLGRDEVTHLCSWAQSVPGIKKILKLNAFGMQCHLVHGPLIKNHTPFPLNPQMELILFFINSRFHKWIIISVCLSWKLLSLARAGKHIQITSPFLSSCLL